MAAADSLRAARASRPLCSCAPPPGLAHHARSRPFLPPPIYSVGVGDTGGAARPIEFHELEGLGEAAGCMGKLAAGPEETGDGNRGMEVWERGNLSGGRCARWRGNWRLAAGALAGGKPTAGRRPQGGLVAGGLVAGGRQRSWQEGGASAGASGARRLVVGNSWRRAC
jgi:hypothetical protein